MAFDITQFNPGLPPANDGPRRHTYVTGVDAIATCVASGYFNPVANHIRTEDSVEIQATDVRRICRLINTANVITTGVAVSFA